MAYPAWAYFPRQTTPAIWVQPFLQIIGARQEAIDSASHRLLVSDDVVALLRDPLVGHGWLVESSKRAADKIHRPVLFGDNGVVRVKQEIDGWHPEERVVLEIESARAVQGNAIYRDLVGASLITDADYLALGVRSRYQYGARNTTQNDFAYTRDALDSIYASGRLGLPFRGILLFGLVGRDLAKDRAAHQAFDCYDGSHKYQARFFGPV
jgi:hypothetical protein